MVVSDKIRSTIDQLSDSMPSTPKVEIRAWKSVSDGDAGPSTSGAKRKPEVPSKPSRGPLTPTSPSTPATPATPTTPTISTATPIIYAVPVKTTKANNWNAGTSSSTTMASSNKPSISAPIMTSTTSTNNNLGPLEKSVPAPVTKSMPTAYAVSNISAPLLPSAGGAGAESKQNNLNVNKHNNSTRSRRTEYDSYNGSSWSRRRDNGQSPSMFKQVGGLTSKCSKNIAVSALAIVCILQFIALVVILAVVFGGGNGDRGGTSITYSLTGQAKPGEVIFHDDFSSEQLNLTKWRHERYLTEDGFVIYGTSKKNSFIRDGMLHIQPTFTADDFNQTFLDYGTLEVGKTIEKSCSSFFRARCLRTANGGNTILNPIRSAILKTSQSFFFKYGTVEFRAKMPKGDWITTEISLRPRYQFYGEPTDSARIVITTSRGNEDYQAENRTHFGQERVCSQLIYSDTYATAVTSMVQFCHNTVKGEGLGDMFHDYKFTWEPDVMRLYIDEIVVGKFVDAMFAPSADTYKHIVVTGDEKTKQKTSFDQPFYIEIKVSVGAGFPEHNMYSPYRKPWVNNRADAPRVFWSSKKSWAPSWTNGSALIIDHMTVRAQ